MSTDTASDVETVDHSADVAAVEEWLVGFEKMVAARDPDAARRLFTASASWRDLLALTWQIRSARGIEDIERWMDSAIRCPLHEIVVRAAPAPTRITVGDRSVLQAVFDFETGSARGQGLVRLVPGAEGSWTAVSLVTDMTELKGVEHTRTTWADAANPEWTTARAGRPNWSDSRDRNRPFPTAAPPVLIVGAGQSGLSVAARLARLGVRSIVIDRNDRVGDSWRQRHYNLITHTVSFADQFPFLPFPESWPLSVGKDKIADWCELYAGAMDVDVWTSTELLTGTHDADGRWTVGVRRADGEVVTLRPQHLLLATGLLSIPHIPDFTGVDQFAGEILHSSQYRVGSEFAGRKVVVVGSGASGHDICQDLWEHGVDGVTMVQRSSTYVMSFERAVPALYSAYYPSPDADVEFGDLLMKSYPPAVAAQLSRAAAPRVAELDRELLGALDATNFETNREGMLALAYRSSGVSGYYIDQGASRLVIDGSITVKNGAVVGFDRSRVLFADGSRTDADVVVLCTGYKSMRESARRHLGDSIADDLPEVWVLDEARGGELGALWDDSGHENLWLMGGSIQHARVYSKHLALKITAVERGVVD